MTTVVLDTNTVVSAISIRPRVVTDTGHLPSNFQSMAPTADAKTIPLNLLRYVEIGRRSADRG